MAVAKETPKRNEKPQEVVFIVDKGSAKLKPVTTGISSAEYIEIKSGVDEGMNVIKGSYRAISRELENGSKVHIEKERFTRRKQEAES